MNRRAPFPQIPLGLTISGGMIRRIFGFLLVLMGSSGYDSLMAQSAGTFTATGSMTTPRANHTATLMTNGKVLIAGGWVAIIGTPTATAELYDPGSGTFTPTGDMTTPRSHHTATLLLDGRVLIPGSSFPVVNSAEIYDPSTGTFAATGNMLGKDGSPKAHLLANGKVLIVSGCGDSDVELAQLYDPATGTFAATGKYSTRGNLCQGAASSLLADGRVLIVWEETGAEIYDPETGSFTTTGNPFPGYNYGPPVATLLMRRQSSGCRWVSLTAQNCTTSRLEHSQLQAT